MLLCDSEIKDLCSEPKYLVVLSNREDHVTEAVLDTCNDLDLARGLAEYHYRKLPLDIQKAKTVSWVGNNGERSFSMITPFVDNLVREVDGKKVISYGLSSYGYDITLAPTIKIFSPTNAVAVDPKAMRGDEFVTMEVTPESGKDYVMIPPNGFILGHSVEYIRMPSDVTGVVLGKSTYARAGISCLATPLEAGWEGQITLEFANCTPLPVKMYINEGCAQVLFHRGNLCDVSYASRKGKYQGQLGITLPTV